MGRRKFKLGRTCKNFERKRLYKNPVGRPSGAPKSKNNPDSLVNRLVKLLGSRCFISLLYDVRLIIGTY